MRLFKQLVAVALIAVAGSQAVAAVDGNPWLTLAAGVLTAVLSLLVYRWVVGRTERRPVTELAGSGMIGGLGGGVLIGFGMFAAVIAVIASFGGYRIEGLGSATGAVSVLGFMAAAAVTEELLFRGILFRIIEERLGTWLSLLLTGVPFGLLHLANEDATLWGATAIAIEAGFMLAACYAATRTLWVPIGLHFGWNFAAGGISGVVVSGNGENDGLLEASMSGSDWLTGGAFGPEGSLVTVAAGVLLTIVFLIVAAVRGRLVPRRRADRADATVTLAR